MSENQFQSYRLPKKILSNLCKKKQKTTTTGQSHMGLKNKYRPYKGNIWIQSILRTVDIMLLTSLIQTQRSGWDCTILEKGFDRICFTSYWEEK